MLGATRRGGTPRVLIADFGLAVHVAARVRQRSRASGGVGTRAAAEAREAEERLLESTADLLNSSSNPLHTLCLCGNPLGGSSHLGPRRLPRHIPQPRPDRPRRPHFFSIPFQTDLADLIFFCSQSVMILRKQQTHKRMKRLPQPPGVDPSPFGF